MVARLFLALVLGLLQLSLGTPRTPMPVRILSEEGNGNGTNTSMDMSTTTTTTKKEGETEDGTTTTTTTKKEGETEDGTKPMKSHSVKVSGTATMVVENAAEFVASPEAKKGVEKAVAKKANVKPDQVEVTLSLVESAGRRLSTATVKMEYTITLPADSSSEAESAGAALMETLESIDTTELSTEIVNAVAEETGVTYVATVQALTAEEPVVEETETADGSSGGSTSSPPKNEDSAGNKQSQVCVLGAALVFWQVFA